MSCRIISCKRFFTTSKLLNVFGADKICIAADVARCGDDYRIATLVAENKQNYPERIPKTISEARTNSYSLY